LTIAESEPTISPRSASEKEASAWWFRQLCTTLVIANAGGVIAVSGFAANTENISVAALIAYPATSLFLAGAVVASFGIIFQFLYTSWRLEAIAEFDRERNSWRHTQGMTSKISVVPTLAFFLLAALTFGSMAVSAVYFYRGAKHASLSTTALACAAIADQRACSSGVLLFGPVGSDLKQRARAAVGSKVPDDIRSAGAIHPDAIPRQGLDHETRFAMRRAAEKASQQPACKRVELVAMENRPTDAVSVICSNGSALTKYVFRHKDLLGAVLVPAPTPVLTAPS
jgi:hypothetical protein